MDVATGSLYIIPLNDYIISIFYVEQRLNFVDVATGSLYIIPLNGYIISIFYVEQRLNFVDVATGSLGQGLSCAAGMAYTGKFFDKSEYVTNHFSLYIP